MSPAEFCDVFDWREDDYEDCREWAVANCATMDDAWAKAKPDWLLWIATRPGVLDDRTLRLFAVWSARQVQHLTTDPRSLAAIDAAERHANGQATDGELAVALAAARAAEWDAAQAAAWAARAAARAAAGGALAAALDAAEAAWATARDARDAAWYAARDVARDAAQDAALASQAAWLRANATPDWERARKMGARP